MYDRSLAAWDDFPVDATPRPAVLLEHPRPFLKFRTAADQRAFKALRWKVPKQLPDAPTTVGGYPTISAADALTYLRRGKPLKTGRGHRVVIESVRFGTYEYATDRGRVELPTWFVKLRGAFWQSTKILAVAPGSVVYFKGWYAPALLSGVEPSADGRALVVHFTGAEPGTGRCQAEYTAGVRESGQAVGIRIVELPKPPSTPRPKLPPGTSYACTAMGYGRTLKVMLDAPLGARVVIEGQGGYAISQAPRRP